MTTIIDGRQFAKALREDVAGQVEAIVQAGHAAPGLAVVLIGDNAASEVYVRNKVKQAREAGMHSEEYRLPVDTSQAELLGVIDKLNQDTRIHGILVQLPLPRQIQEKAVINAVDADKDVDGFHLLNTGLLSIGEQGLVPCTPLGCLLMLKDKLGDLSGLQAVIIGRSNIVGKPMANLLLQENCTITITHSHTRNLPGLCRSADILVAAVGRPHFVQGDWIKPGAAVIDVGINRIEDGGKTRLVGDVDFKAASKVAGFITPVPGGVGPMTIACLLANTVAAARLQLGLDEPGTSPCKH